jgi:hypothetical protein
MLAAILFLDHLITGQDIRSLLVTKVERFKNKMVGILDGRFY